jgi:hypothetical protein
LDKVGGTVGFGVGNLLKTDHIALWTRQWRNQGLVEGIGRIEWAQLKMVVEMVVEMVVKLVIIGELRW